jgi:hypothetical protein
MESGFERVISSGYLQPRTGLASTPAHGPIFLIKYVHVLRSCFTLRETIS